MISRIVAFLTSKINPLAIVQVIVANLELDIDTVKKSDGKYLRVRVEAWGITIADQLIKLTETGEIDYRDSPEHRKAVKELDQYSSKQARETLESNSIIN